MRWGMKAAAVLVIAVCGVPANALAAAPANDAFANRELLGASLPIEVTRSNVEATKEEGEFISPFGAGHSIWFEWEAPATEWVTIGACDDQFPSVVRVFTGTELANLTPVVNGNQDEGPDCLYIQRQYTFKAVGGTKYVIAADGTGFFVPPPPPDLPPPPPVTEGEVVLRIEPTPPPPNDAFANAEQVNGGISEEPGGARFYFAHFDGYNWKATSEPGEFTFGSSPVDSVWFRWTPPETGTYRLGGPCCASGLNWGLFSGDSFDMEHEMLAASGSAEVSVVGGTEYWIDVYGIPLSAGAEPTMGSFGFNISANLQSLPAQPPSSSPAGGRPVFSASDTIAPDTRIDKSSLLAARGSAKFWFTSSEPGGFRCRLDARQYRPCASGQTYRNLQPGRHAFRVQAVDMAGNADGTPAIVRFRVPSRYRRHR